MFKVVKINRIEVTFNGNIKKSKKTVVLETKSITKALKFAYKEYSKHEGHNLSMLQDNYCVKKDNEVICTFGYHITKRLGEQDV